MRKINFNPSGSININYTKINTAFKCDGTGTSDNGTEGGEDGGEDDDLIGPPKPDDLPDPKTEPGRRKPDVVPIGF